MGHESPIQQRLNITFGKFGALKYTSTLDIAKVWERVLRRAKLPILYTQGFNTRPRIQIASALPLGITSECEIIDVSLREVLPTLDGIGERIASVCPEGLRIYSVVDVPARSPALQSLVRSAEYRVSIIDELDERDLQSCIDNIMAQDHILKVKIRKKNRRKTTSDLRPLIYDLYLDDNGDLIAHLAAGERGNLRPSDLIDELGLQDVYHTIHRFRLHMDEYYKNMRWSTE
jgi:radical SAM-linked protein